MVETQPLPPLLDALAALDVQPLWDRYMRVLTREPRPRDAPLSWSWAAMQPLIQRAVREVSMEDAERRVLLFCNPAFAPDITTTTNLSSGLQILQPGEAADAHRHTAAALRLVMSGAGAVTWVNGKRCEMAEGDLILTPPWCWHEHRNEGNEQVIWFDGLDVPLVQHLSAVFLEFGPPGPVPVQYDDALARAGALPPDAPPEYRHYSPRYRYEASAIAAALDATAPAPDGSRLLRYTNPHTGGAVMRTLDCYALRLAAGRRTQPYRTTANAVVVATAGQGATQVGNQVMEWNKGDVFTVPHWHWVSHLAETADAQLFLMTDQSVLETLGYLRTERDPAALHP